MSLNDSGKTTDLIETGTQLLGTDNPGNLAYSDEVLRPPSANVHSIDTGGARLGIAERIGLSRKPLEVSSVANSESWTIFGRKTQRSKLEWVAQVLVLYILIITCLVNITLNNGNRELWSTLLGSSIGYLLPSPRMKVANNNVNPAK